MGSIRVTEFGGIKPRDYRSYGGPSRASVARNVKLWHGTLEPWRYPSKIIDSGQDNVCSIYKDECCFVVSDQKCASFAKGDTDCNRVFSTGILDCPAYAALPDCSSSGNQGCGEIPALTWYKLGVPAPTSAPTITGQTLTPQVIDCTVCDSSEQRKRENRAYLYSFVNAYGEESSQSPVSAVIDADIDSAVTLGFSIPPTTAGFDDPVGIRIYRAGSGWSEEGSWENAMADFYFVEEIPFQSGNFTHIEDVPPDCLGEPFSTEGYCEPPCDLQGITSTDDGVLVGFEGKNLWFTEPWQFHAWTCHLNLDDCIKSIEVNGAYIYVATDAFPYVVSIKNNEEECKCCREVNKLREPAPISCPKSMAKTNNGVIWATDVGLVKISGNQMQIETHAYMAEDDWREWYPHDLHGEYYKGMYFGFNAERGFIWDLTDGIYSDAYLGDSGKFTTLDLTPQAVYRTDQNELIMSIKGDLYKWDDSDTYMPYTWRTKLHVEGGLANFSMMKIVFEKYLRTRKTGNPVEVRLFADDKLMFARKVNCSRPFRLPKGYDALNWEIEITGTETVMEIHMATSQRELILLNNA